MTEVVTVGSVLAAWGVSFFAALAYFSLRNFSRSRLEDLCRRQGREARLGTILKYDADAELVCELLAITGLGCMVVGVSDLGLAGPPEVGAELGGWLLRLGVWLVLLLATVVVLPRALSLVASESVVFHVWPVLSALLIVAAPAVAAIRGFDRLLHRWAGMEVPSAEDGNGISEEIRTVVEEGHREGIVEPEARSMIQRVMELREVDVADIMTPRTAMVTISAEASLEQARTVLLAQGHSRIPVIGKTTDDVLGVLYAKDLLRYLNTPEPVAAPVTLAEIAREPLYVPETMGIDTLLTTFKRERVHLAIVLDEYGGVAGLVTMEDIFEEIVGEITDEYDTAAVALIEKVAADIHDVDARIHIDDLNAQLNLKLPADGDFDTLGGFAFSQIGRVPQPGEQFRWEDLRFTVLEADKRKIIRLRISQAEDAPASTTSSAE